MGLGLLLERIGDGASSERAYGAAAGVLAGANIGDWVNVRRQQAQLDLQMGRYAAARASLQETLTLAERSGRSDLVGLVHLNLATTLRELSDPERAADHLAQAARCQPCRSLQQFPADLLYERGRLAMNRGAFAEAQ